MPNSRSLFDASAPKRPYNLSLNTDLVAQVRKETDNLSAQIEVLLAEFLARRREEADAHEAGLARAAAGWNGFLAQHGSFADEFNDL